MKKDLDIAIKYLFYSGEPFTKLHIFYKFYKYLATDMFSSIENLYTAIKKWDGEKFQHKICKIIVEHPDLFDCTESEIVELNRLLRDNYIKVASRTPISIEEFEKSYNNFYDNKIDIKLALDCDETLIRGLSRQEFNELYERIFRRLLAYHDGTILQMRFISKFIELESKLNKSDYRITLKTYYRFWYTRTNKNIKMLVFMSNNVRLKYKIARYLFVSECESDIVIEYLLDTKRYALFSDYGHHYSALYKRDLFKIILGSLRKRFEDGYHHDITIVLQHLKFVSDLEYFKTHYLTRFVDILNIVKDSWNVIYYINQNVDSKLFQQLFHDSYVKYGDEYKINIKFICLDGKIGLELI